MKCLVIFNTSDWYIILRNDIIMRDNVIMRVMYVIMVYTQ